jgi:hypothetical protein
MEIYGSGKNQCRELVPCVEVNVMSKFHLVWGPIAQESNLEEMGRFWEKIAFLETSQWTMSGPADNVQPYANNV